MKVPNPIESNFLFDDEIYHASTIQYCVVGKDDSKLSPFSLVASFFYI